MQFLDLKMIIITNVSLRCTVNLLTCSVNTLMLHKNDFFFLLRVFLDSSSKQ